MSHKEPGTLTEEVNINYTSKNLTQSTVVGHNLVPQIFFDYIFYTKQQFFINPLFL
jgi:hypothetical protein